MPYNATTNSLSGLASVGSLTPIIVITLAILISMIMLLSYEPIMKKLLKFIAFLKKTFGYFFYGIGGSIILCGLYLFTRMNIKQVQSGNPIFLKTIMWIVIVYIGMTLFGFIIKKFVVDKIKRSYKKAKKDIQ